MPVFVGAGTSSFMKASDGIGFTRLNTTQRNALTAVQGQVIFNTTTGVLEYYDGSNWAKVSSVLAVLNSVSGNIIDGLGSTLTLSGTGFLTANLVVNFLQSQDSINVDVTVNPSSDTAASVSVPASVYNNVTAGRVVTIKVTNSDGSSSQGVNKTAVGLPSGGTINTYSGYRSHKFTSSGTWTNTALVSSADVLIVAGGGGGGADNSGGGGAGGMLVQTGVSVSAQNYTITVGAGGNGSGISHGDGGPYATNGANSAALGYTVTGGGRGGSAGGANANSGGSGGGGSGESANSTGGAGTSGQGNAGGNHVNSGGGGGGGKGAVGQNGNVRGTMRGGNGGVGAANSFETGSNQNYAAGGGGGNENGQYDAQSPASGIGGVTNSSVNNRATSGTNGTGAGGGASTHTSNPNPSGGDGGDGVVVIRYAV
tara:strand:- start:1110 stop:2387 length:1278 start_codon:yes stop_codon:yes gene_type:complete